MASLVVSPNPVNFGSVTTGNSQIVQMTCQDNDPFTDINCTTASIDNPKFTILSLAFPFNPPPFTVMHGGGTRLFRIQYTAGTPGTDTGNLTINSDADNNPVVIPLTGTSVASGGTISVIPRTVIFPNTRINTNSAQVSFVITNTGTANVTVQVPVINGPFTGVGLPGAPTVLTPTQTLVFNVEFSPVSTGYIVQSNGIAITSTAPSSVDNVDLEGLAVPIIPAYIANGGVENGYFAVGPLLRQFSDSNFNCEEQDVFLEKLLLLSGPGYEDCILRIEVQYINLGIATLEAEVSNEHGQSDRQTVQIGTGLADSSVMNTQFDLKIVGELLTMFMVPVGPVAIISIVPKYQIAGEVKK